MRKFESNLLDLVTCFIVKTHCYPALFLTSKLHVPEEEANNSQEATYMAEFIGPIGLPT